jgi:nucleotide-binding universal stress UspA family protein
LQEVIMSKKFLVAVDGSEHGSKAADLAADLAKASDAELILLHVIDELPVTGGLGRYAQVEGVSLDELNARYRATRSLSDAVIDEAETRARKTGVTRVSSQVVEGDAAAAIVEQAKLANADMVFLGSHGLSDIQGLLIGSVSHKVLHQAPCTCVVVR